MSDESYSGGEEEREEPAKAATVGAKAEDRRKSGGKAVPSMSRWLGEGLMAFVEAGEEEQVQGQQKGEEEVEEGRKLGRVR